MAHMRRASSLRNVVAKRSSINAPVNLNSLVRVYLLDGSSKVLQMFSNSTAKEVLIALKFNLDLNDISTFALFRVVGNNVRRVELNEVITEVMKDPTNSGQEVRLLFRSWITFKYGAFDHEVFQHTVRNKQANTALWLAFMEAVFMCMTGKFYLTDDEAIMLGCLKVQAESGDFNPMHHDLRIMKNRISSRFPEPIRSKMKSLMAQAASNPSAAMQSDELAGQVQSLYARIAGKSKVEAQINYLESLRTWCPFYGSTLYEVQCQYDDNPLDPSSSPPVIAMNAWIGPLAIFLLTPTDPPVVMRHPYRRIIKWVTLPDKHIFTYWVIKPHVTLSDLEAFQAKQLRKQKKKQKGKNHHNQSSNSSDNEEEEEEEDEEEDQDQEEEASGETAGGEVDAQQFCDCVYLVTSQVKELDYLVKSYVEATTGTPPVLPGASDDLMPIKVHLSHHPSHNPHNSSSKKKRSESSEDHDARQSEGEQDDDDDNDDGDDRKSSGRRHQNKKPGLSSPPIPTAETAKKPRVGRLSLFFSSLGGGGGGGGDGFAGSGVLRGHHPKNNNHDNDDDDDDENNNNDNDDSEDYEEDGMMGEVVEHEEEEHFGDDTAAVTNSWFRNMYKQDKKTKQNKKEKKPMGSSNNNNNNNSNNHSKQKRKSILEDDAKPHEIAEQNIPMNVKYAASMSELKRMAEESQFSDEEDDDNEDVNGKKSSADSDEEEDDEEEDEEDGEEGDHRVAKRSLPGISSSTAFRRASRILFG